MPDKIWSTRGVPQALRHAVRDAAKSRGISQGSLVTEALQRYLAHTTPPSLVPQTAVHPEGRPDLNDPDLLAKIETRLKVLEARTEARRNTNAIRRSVRDLVARGYSDKDIAERLGMPVPSVFCFHSTGPAEEPLPSTAPPPLKDAASPNELTDG